MGVCGPGVRAWSVGGEMGGEESPRAIGSSLTIGFTLATVLRPCGFRGSVMGIEKGVEEEAEVGEEDGRRDAVEEGMGRVMGEAPTSPIDSFFI